MKENIFKGVKMTTAGRIEVRSYCFTPVCLYPSMSLNEWHQKKSVVTISYFVCSFYLVKLGSGQGPISVHKREPHVVECMGGMQEDILDNINTKSYGGKTDLKMHFHLIYRNNDNTRIPGNSNLGPNKYFPLQLFFSQEKISLAIRF